MENVKDFLKRKDIVISPQRYLIEALGAMAQGLFASLLIGTIIKTLGQQTGLDVLVDLGGYAKAMWCGDSACEDKLKDATGGVKSRCIPFKEEHLSDVCVCCGKPAKKVIYFAKAY